MNRINIFAAFWAISAFGFAETAAQAGSDNAATAISKGFAEVSGVVMKAADMVPQDKYNYRPTNSVRTFGQLVAHITDGWNFFCSRAAGKRVEWSDATEKGTLDKATLMQKLKTSLDGCKVEPGSGSGLMVGNIAHTNLHYGNMVTYIRMLGMQPPSN